MRRRLIALALAAAALAGCGSGEETETETGPPPAERDRERADPPDRPPVGDGRGGVELEQVGEFEQPLGVVQPRRGDDSLYVVEQCGRIIRLRPGGGRDTFLDLTGEVSCGGEQGLLSLAFAPDYPRSGLLYVDYTDTAGDTRIVEYRATGDRPTVEPGSARELLRIEQPYPNHNGGLLLFGPDGGLYAGTGDGGSAGDPERTAQDLGSLLGKLLRIDPRPAGGEPYGIPGSNPFAGEDGARPEILAYGLRNPWRFSFDRETAELWIADVGQDELEEVNGPISDPAAGHNFGWSAFEGTTRFNADQEAPGAIAPIHTYSIDGEECSIAGGYVVRDPSLESLYGRYLYGDLCTGELRSFAPRGGEARGDRALGPEVASLSAFGEDAEGRIYATSLEGPVYRLRGE